MPASRGSSPVGRRFQDTSPLLCLSRGQWLTAVVYVLRNRLCYRYGPKLLVANLSNVCKFSFALDVVREAASVTMIFSRSSRFLRDGKCFRELCDVATNWNLWESPGRWIRCIRSATTWNPPSLFCSVYRRNAVASFATRGPLRIIEPGASLYGFKSAFPEVKYEDVKRMVQQDSGIIIDVRDPSERENEGRIPGAINIPMFDLPEMLALKVEDLRARYHIDKLDSKHDAIVFHCRGGVRSEQACQIAKQLGYKNVKNYKGSIVDWNERERGSQMGY